MAVDVLFVHPGNQKRTYQDLSKEFTAIATPVWTSLLAGNIRNNGYSTAIYDVNVDGWDENVPEEASRLMVADQVQKEEKYRSSPQAAAPTRTEIGAMISSNIIAEGRAGKAMKKMAYKSDSVGMPIPGFYKTKSLVTWRNNWAMSSKT